MILPRIRHFINIYLVTCVGDPNGLFHVCIRRILYSKIDSLQVHESPAGQKEIK